MAVSQSSLRTYERYHYWAVCPRKLETSGSQYLSLTALGCWRLSSCWTLLSNFSWCKCPRFLSLERSKSRFSKTFLGIAQSFRNSFGTLFKWLFELQILKYFLVLPYFDQASLCFFCRCTFVSTHRCISACCSSSLPLSLSQICIQALSWAYWSLCNYNTWTNGL